MFNSGEKKTIAIVALVAMAVVAVVGSAVGVLVATGSSHKDDAYIQLAVGDELHTVAPARWCDVFMRQCTPGINRPQNPTPRVPVPVNSTVLLSVSESIAESPWNLTTLYSTPRGLVEEESPQFSNTTYTVILRSRPDRVLLGVTITAAAALDTNAAGTTNIARGLITADTAPAR